jgi:hypothetical protein
MIEGIIEVYNNVTIGPSGEDLVEALDVPARSGVSFIFDGHSEPLVLTGNSGISGPPMEAGKTWFSGPYQIGNQYAPEKVASPNGPTTLDIYVVRDDSDSFQHGPTGDVVSVDNIVDTRAGAILAEADPITSTSSEQSVPLDDPSTGATLTDGDDRLDVSGYGSLTVRVAPGASGADFRVQAHSSTFGAGDDIFDEGSVTTKKIIGVEARDVTGVREIKIFEDGTDGEDQQIAAYVEV